MAGSIALSETPTAAAPEFPMKPHSCGMPTGIPSSEDDGNWNLPAPALFGTSMRTALLQ